MKDKRKNNYKRDTEREKINTGHKGKGKDNRCKSKSRDKKH